MNEGYGILDPDNLAQVEEYEQHFYRAYAGLTDNKLVHLIWDWDNARRRLKTKIPYTDQVVYTWRDDAERLVAAMAVNLNPERNFQASTFGFTLPPGGGAGYPCEILNLMATVHHQGWASSSYFAFIRDFGYGTLVIRGYDLAYSTCTRRRLKPYLRLGAKLLDQTIINGEERFFLLWPLRELVPASHQG